MNNKTGIIISACICFAICIALGLTAKSSRNVPDNSETAKDISIQTSETSELTASDYFSENQLDKLYDISEGTEITSYPAATSSSVSYQETTKTLETETTLEVTFTDTETSGSDTDNTALSYITQVVDIINKEREAAGISGVIMLQELNQAASIRAKETAQSFSHTRPDGTSFYSVLSDNNITYRTCGENIAMGQKPLNRL